MAQKNTVNRFNFIFRLYFADLPFTKHKGTDRNLLYCNLHLLAFDEYFVRL